MIHTIYVNQESNLADLKKLFRKKLMTGGAVIRLSPKLSHDAMKHIFETFAAEVLEDNLAAMVLKELAAVSDLPIELQEKLGNLSIKSISRTLLIRKDCSEIELKQALPSAN